MKQKNNLPNCAEAICQAAYIKQRFILLYVFDVQYNVCLTSRLRPLITYEKLFLAKKSELEFYFKKKDSTMSKVSNINCINICATIRAR